MEEYAGEEGLTPDEALAEIEEFAEEDSAEEEMADAVSDADEQDNTEKQ